MDRFSAPDEGLVLAINNSVFIKISVFRVTGLYIGISIRYSVFQHVISRHYIKVIVLIRAVIHITVHHPHGIAYFSNVVISTEVSVHVFRGNDGTLVFCQLLYFISVKGDIETGVPAKIFIGNIYRIYSKLYTLVLYLAHVFHSASITGRGR